MIRIDLLRGHRRGRRRALIAAVPLVVLALLFAVGLADRFHEAREQLSTATWDRVFGRQPGEEARAPSSMPVTVPGPAEEPRTPVAQQGASQEDGQREPPSLSSAPGPGVAGPGAPPSHAPVLGAASPDAPQASAPAAARPAVPQPLAGQAAARPAPVVQPGTGQQDARRPPAPQAGLQAYAQLPPARALAAPTPGSGSRQGRTCGRLLQFGVRLSASMRLATLTCTPVEYQAEGTAPAAQVGQFHALLDSLRQLPSQASISLWRAGKAQEDQPYRFVLQGRMPEPAQSTLEPQTVDAAAALFGRVSRWARRAELQLLAEDALPSVQVAAGLRQERLRVRVMGSGAQLGVLADSLRRVETSMGLDELVLAEVFRRELEEPRLQLTAVLQALVQAPGPLP